jgi:hypothetical protein
VEEKEGEKKREEIWLRFKGSKIKLISSKRSNLFLLGLEIRRKEGSSINLFLLKISSLKGIFLQALKVESIRPTGLFFIV